MSRIVPCPNPPGGHIVCDDHQLGVCSVQDGRRVAGCLALPDHFAAIADRRERNLALANWVLSVVMTGTRSAGQPLEDEERRLLASGEYRRPDGDIVRFTLPVDLDLDGLQGVVAVAY